MAEDKVAKLTELFQKYDADNSGFLEKAEVEAAIIASDVEFTQAESEALLKKVEADGKISLQDFLANFS